MDVDQDHTFRHPQRSSSPSSTINLASDNANGAQVSFQGRPEPRSAQACDVCRQRKIKCDQQQPCSSCIRSGKPAACTFSPPARRKSHKASERRASSLIENVSSGLDREVAPATQGGSVWSGPYTAPQGGFRAINQPQATIAQPRTTSESRSGEGNNDELYHKASHSRSALHAAIPQEPVRPHTQAGVVSVKRQKSRYIQSSHPTLLIEREIPEVRQSIDRLVRENETRSKLSKIRNTLPKPVKEEPATLISSSVHNFIPEQAICDRLFETFFATWGSVFHILERTNFQSSYHDFFQEPTQPPAETMFAYKLALAAASVSELDAAYNLSSIERRQLSRQTEAWLDSLPRNVCSSIDYLEVQCLLYLVRYSLGISPLDAWCSTGNMVRCAMGQGLHQDPEQVQSLSPRQRQGRKRLWSTILELECQAALVAGMRSEVRPDELVPASLPIPASAGQASHLAAQAQQSKAYWHSLPDQLVESLPSRLALVNAIASGTVLAAPLGSNEHLASAPVVGTSQDSRVTLARVLIDLSYCRPYLIAYQMLAEEGTGSADSATGNARARCVELSLRVINHLETFDADIADLPEHEALLCWQFIGKAHFDLILHAAYVLCLELQRIHGAQSSPPSHSKATIIHTLNRTLTSFLEKDPNLNIHIKDLIRLALIIQYVRTGSSVDRKEELMRQALDRVVEACNRRAGAMIGASVLTNGFTLETTPSDLFDGDMFGFDLNGDFTRHLPSELNNFG